MWKPLFQCFALGALLFAAERLWLSPAEASIDTIEITPAVREEVVREARALTGREPTAADVERRLDIWIDDEVLVREARRLGLDRGDPVIFTRLVQNMRFVAGGSAESAQAPTGEQADALYREALELGMDRSDLVVRRRLIQQMRFVLEAPGRAESLDEAELERYLQSHPERFQVPARVALVQVYLSRDRRGAALEADAAALVERLRAQPVAPADALIQADPFLHPARQPLQSERQLAKQFGPDFARAVLRADAPRGAWFGPVKSAYGLHAVWIEERREAALPPLGEVRTAVVAELRNQRARASFSEGLAGLRERHRVVRRDGDAS